MNLSAKIHRKSEQEYRALAAINYSSIVDYIDDRKLYYRKYVLREKIEREVSYAMTLGCMVDSLLLGVDGEFDSKFVVTTAIEPKGQMLDFVNNLYTLTVRYMSEEGEVTQSMENLLQEAYQMTAFDRNNTPIAFKGKTFEYVVDKFVADGELYYKQLRANYGKTVVSMHMIDIAQKIVNELKLNSNTAHIFHQLGDHHNQLPIEFSYRGYDMKVLPDKFVINHEEAYIQPYDLKVTSQSFPYSYLKNRYDIQACVYRLGLMEWCKEMGLNYHVRPMQFIVADSSNYYEPLIYKTDYQDFERTLKGFSINGRSYMGVDDALDGIAWNLSSANWRISKENAESNGLVLLNLNYE